MFAIFLFFLLYPLFLITAAAAGGWHFNTGLAKANSESLPAVRPEYRVDSL